jgi:hypothetical protein
MGYEAEYPVRYTEHTHVVCVKAIPDCDIAIALLDETVGSVFDPGEFEATLKEELVNRGILFATSEESTPPTILQVEVLLAKSLGKPTIVLTPRSFDTVASATINVVGAARMEIAPRQADAPALNTLVAERDWWALHHHYVVQTGGVDFGQCAFLEKMKREPPNWVTTCDDFDDIEALKRMLRSRIGEVVMEFVPNSEWAGGQLDRKRDPIGVLSLGDLVRNGEIVPAPYLVRSGTGDAESPLLPSKGGNDSLLIDLMSEGRSALILGRPGLGKSTTLMLFFAALGTASSDLRLPQHVMYVSLREVSSSVTDASGLIREAVGLAHDRAPWPSDLEIPAVGMAFLLDGVDEWALDEGIVERILVSLRQRGPIVASCRLGEFARRLEHAKDQFEVILELVAWQGDQVRAYSEGLRRRGWSRAATYVVDHGETFTGRLFGIPLWLSMISYLLRPEAPEGSVPQTDVEVLRKCAWAVARDQCDRYHLGSDQGNVERLARVWRDCAWKVHSARRHGAPHPLLADVLAAAALPDTQWDEPVSSVLDADERVHGFFHEVFMEYWLAERLQLSLTAGLGIGTQAQQMLRLQRSPETNEILRELLFRDGDDVKVALAMKDVYPLVASNEVFEKNQLIYFAGRLSDVPEVKEFIRSVWFDAGETIFVRISAAFAAIPLGEDEIEAELLRYLSESTEWDEINRGYHLFYYGDVDVQESALPYRDSGDVSAHRTIMKLIERLNRTTVRALALRRIEIRTLANLLRSRAASGEYRESILGLADHLRERAEGRVGGYQAGVLEEIANLLQT